MAEQQKFPLDWTGPIGLVTGASRGIGKAIAWRLAQQGFGLFLHYHQAAALAENLAQEIMAATGVPVQAIAADLTQPAAITQMFATLKAQVNRLEVVINNAGEWQYQTLADLPLAAMDHLYALNTRAPLLVIQESLPMLHSGARIINVSSWATVSSGLGVGFYAATKAALEQITISLAKELGPRGITVNAILPGYTLSESFAAASSPAYLAEVAQLSPLQRIGQPDDIAQVVAFLASPAAAWVTGQRIQVTGGL